MLIAVGLGEAVVTKNGKIVIDGEKESYTHDKYYTTNDAEELARQDLDNDWRIILNAPLSMREYQRQGESMWVLVKKGQGFA